jgi:hypothetical protein
MLAFALTSQGLRVLLLHGRVFRTGVARGILETFAKCGHDQRLFECRIIEIRQGFFRMLRGGNVSGSGTPASSNSRNRSVPSPDVRDWGITTSAILPS